MTASDQTALHRLVCRPAEVLARLSADSLRAARDRWRAERRAYHEQGGPVVLIPAGTLPVTATADEARRYADERWALEWGRRADGGWEFWGEM